MTQAEREQLRISLLGFLSANASGRFGMPLRFLTQQARAEGRPRLTEAEVEAELIYLEDPDKRLVAQTFKSISPDIRAWRITAAGRDYLAALTGE